MSMPPLVKAYRIQEKVKGIGFDWKKPEEVWEKVQEEMNELQDEVQNNSEISKIEDEFGDLLFSLVNYARFIGINPEDALERTNRKFIKRFQFMEKETFQKGMSLESMSLEEMDFFWEKAKKQEK